MSQIENLSKISIRDSGRTEIEIWCRKRKYRSRGSAARALKQYQAKIARKGGVWPKRAYKCPYCVEAWHLTSQVPRGRVVSAA